MSSEKKNERMNQKQKEIMKIECIYIYIGRQREWAPLSARGEKNYKHAYTENKVGVEIYIFTTQKIFLYKFTLVLGFYIFYILTFNNDVTCHSMDQLYLNLPHLFASFLCFKYHFLFTYNIFIQFLALETAIEKNAS